MPDLIDILEQYIHEQRMAQYLWTPEYYQALQNSEAHLASLHADLTANQFQALEDLLHQENTIHYLENHAALRAALVIGIELACL